MPFSKPLQRVAWAAFLCGLSVSIPPAQASLITFTASSANLSNNGPVDASTTITTLANQIDVTLTDLQAGIRSAGQEVSGIIITLNVAPTSVSIGKQRRDPDRCSQHRTRERLAIGALGCRTFGLYRHA